MREKKAGRVEVRDLATRLIERGWSTKRVLWAVRRASPATRTTASTVEALRQRTPQSR
jgi:hypothetical protein